MVVLQDGDGLVFWPEGEIASWTPDFRNRWRAVRYNGEVAHCPTPPPQGPWVRLRASWVLPGLLTLEDGCWKDPAGFVYAWQPLPAVAPLPAAAMPNLPCSVDQFFQVTRKPRQDCQWTTDVGDFSSPRVSDEELRAIYPQLLRLSGYRYLNIRRLRRIFRDGNHIRFVFDNGQEIREWTSPSHESDLGLPNLVHLEPRCPGLYYGASLRDWPFELANAPAEVLRRHFDNPRTLISNVIWQAFRYREAGHVVAYGTSHRDFWYEPLVTVLQRAGLIHRDASFAKAKKLYLMFEQILGSFVIDHGFFTLRQFGFRDSRPEMRLVGDRLPQVVVVAEKKSLRRTLERLHKDLGVTTLLLSGQPSLLATEYLAEAIGSAGEVVVLALTDYDPAGYIIGESVVNQLRFFGLKVAEVRYVLKPELFTAEELELLALPCKLKTKRQRTLAERWLEKGGGIGGKAMGIHANHLRPYGRVRGRIEEMLQSARAAWRLTRRT